MRTKISNPVPLVTDIALSHVRQYNRSVETGARLGIGIVTPNEYLGRVGGGKRVSSVAFSDGSVLYVTDAGELAAGDTSAELVEYLERQAERQSARKDFEATMSSLFVAGMVVYMTPEFQAAAEAAYYRGRGV